MVNPKNRTILVVDDSIPTCFYFKALLEKNGYQVITAHDGISGAKAAMENLPDLILLDKEMPEMHGFQVSKTLREHHETKGIPILMISSEDDTQERIKGLKMGADDFISKDVSPEELHSKIHAFLRIKDLQDQLKNESDKLNQIFRYLHEPVAICSQDDHVVLASQVFLSLLRMPREVATFKSMTEILTILEVPHENIVKLREGCSEDLRLTIKIDGTITHFTARTARIQLSEGERAMAYIFRDVTREVENQKLRADFHSMIAHDLRSPMSVIQGYVSLMATGKTGPINKTQVEFMESVNRKISEMTSLLNDFLDMSKMDAGFVNLNCQEHDLLELIEEVMADLGPLADSRNLSLALNPPGLRLVVNSDPLRLTQILRNLLSNAIKYNVDNGYIRLTVVEQSGWARISVADGGIGMSSEELEVLFDPYTRGHSHKTIKGVGLGIVIVKKLVEAHGGNVTVASEQGKGTTITFTIPLAKSHAKTADLPEEIRNEDLVEK